jgi:hypothetical protein
MRKRPAVTVLPLALAGVLAAAPAVAAAPASLGVKTTERRIAEGFAALGMGAEQRECYGRVIAARLGGENRAEAVAIVEGAETGEDVRAGVKGGGLAIVSAFLEARAECGGE